MPSKKLSKKTDSKAKSNTTEVSQTVKDVLKDFTASWDYAKSSWHERWRNNNYLYNGQRVKRGYIGISNTFVPMCFSTVETLTAALFGAKPKYNFLPPRERSDQNTDILNGLLDFYWDKDQWSLKNINTGRLMFKLGTAIDYYMWGIDHPIKINIPIRDFFIDPTASSLENARYMGRRYLTTKKELESFEVIDFSAEPDEQGNYPMKKKYKNLDKLDTYKTLEGTDKEEKDMWYGSTLSSPPDDQVEVLEYWTLDKVISIANRCTEIEDQENYFLAKAKALNLPNPTGLMPFNDARDYVDESLFYAKGEIDFIADQQEDLNDITNQNKDAITYALNQMYTLDPKHSDQIATVENLPGAVYPFEAGTLVPVPRGNIPSDAFAERQNIKNEMRETTASNETVKGAPVEGGKATATEINAQIAGAGQRTNLKVTQIENGYFYREAKIVFAMVKLYVTEPMMVRIIGQDGARWEEFKPAEFQGEYEPRVQLDISIENKRAQEAKEAADLLAAFRGDPAINQQALDKIVLQRAFKLDPDEVEMLLAVDPMAGALPPDAGAGLPPETPPKTPPNPIAALFGGQEPAPMPMPEGMPV